MAVITCTHCGASGNAPDQILGQQVRCSKCKQSFVAGGEPPTTISSLVDEPVPEPEQEDEGFPTNDDIARPKSRRGVRREEDDDEEADERPRRSIRKPGGGFGDLLMFRRMVAPTIIIILFWLGTIGAVVGAVGMMGIGVAAGGAGIASGVLGGLAMLVIGPLAVRLWCEVVIVVFRINETLAEIRDELHKRK
jgi:hypothetical protein